MPWVCCASWGWPRRPQVCKKEGEEEGACRLTDCLYFHFARSRTYLLCYLGGKRGDCVGFVMRPAAESRRAQLSAAAASSSSRHAARRTPATTPSTPPPLQRRTTISTNSKSRRDVWTQGGASALLGALGLLTLTPPRIASAADAAAPAAAPAGPKKWMSGKSEKPRGSKDRTGTKKDSNYLRCLSDCTTDCRRPGQGPSKDNAECLEACQDYCCQTYEQCTYTQNYEG